MKKRVIQKTKSLPKKKKDTNVIKEQEPKVGLFNLIAPAGSHKKRKLLGRGSGSGHGKTSTRGSKGQTSRAGRDFYAGFEGGQTPLIRRMPKRGFINKLKKRYQLVNLIDLKKVKDTIIDPQTLKNSGLIKNKEGLVKILGNGTFQPKETVTLRVHAISKNAASQIKNSGGKVEIINA